MKIRGDFAKTLCWREKLTRAQTDVSRAASMHKTASKQREKNGKQFEAKTGETNVRRRVRQTCGVVQRHRKVLSIQHSHRSEEKFLRSLFGCIKSIASVETLVSSRLAFASIAPKNISLKSSAWKFIMKWLSAVVVVLNLLVVVNCVDNKREGQLK